MCCLVVLETTCLIIVMILTSRTSGQAGLDVLITPLKTHGPPGPKHPGAAVVFKAIGLEPPARQLDLNVARGHKALQLVVVTLLISF